MDKASLLLSDNTTLALAIAFIAVAALAIWLLATGVYRLAQRKLLSGVGRGVIASLLLAMLALAAAFGLNLYTYHRFTQEQILAHLSFQQTGEQTYSVTVEFPDKHEQTYPLHGDEWQLDARVLKWQGAATLLGLDALYRLERLSGRYQDVQQERTRERSVYALADNPGLDLWRVVHDHRQWLPWVDASYGSATYLPMADGAVYTVYLSNSGLLARPTNTAAADAVKAWR